MTETYTFIGTEPGWVIAIVPIPAVLFRTVLRRWASKKWTITWPEVFFIGYFVAATLARLPVNWIVSGAVLSFGIYMLSCRHHYMRPPVRIALGSFMIAMACVYPWLLRFPRDADIEMKNESLRFDNQGAPAEVRRKDVRIDVIFNPPSGYIRPWGSWTTYSDHGERERQGPSLRGTSVYWGPHGLIWGDDLALRLAEWAGVTPVNRSYTMSAISAR